MDIQLPYLISIYIQLLPNLFTHGYPYPTQTQFL